MTFFGSVFSASGYSPDPEKIQGITEMTPPQMKQELQSFLGAVNYLQTFMSPTSIITQNCYVHSSKRRTALHGMRTLNTSFQKIKSLLQKALLKPLKYYNRNKPVTLQCDSFTQGTRSLHHTGWPSHSFCEQVSHWYRDMICKHQEGTPSHHVQLWEVPHLPVQ